jgi:hypothetical protein
MEVISMGFMNNLKSESNLEKNLTENYAVAYRTSGDEFLDFNFRITDLRSCEEKEIISAFKKLSYVFLLLFPTILSLKIRIDSYDHAHNNSSSFLHSYRNNPINQFETSLGVKM